MAETELTVQAVTRDVLLIEWADADVENGNTFLNDGNVYLIASNLEVSEQAFCIITPLHVNGLDVDDRHNVVPAKRDSVTGPFPVGVYSDAQGFAHLTYPEDTELQVAVVRPANV